jgi:hypothetical protein
MFIIGDFKNRIRNLKTENMSKWLNFFKSLIFLKIEFQGLENKKKGF